MVIKHPLIREIFMADHNVAMVAVVRTVDPKINKCPFQQTLDFSAVYIMKHEQIHNTASSLEHVGSGTCFRLEQ